MTTKISFSELLERAKTEKIAIHTLTKKQAITLLKELNKNGYTWRGGSKLTSATYYEFEKKNTCYSFRDRYGKLRDKEVWYCSLDWHQENNYTIIKFSDIIFAKPKITFKDLLERAKSEKIAVHTPTEKQATILLKALDKRGDVWTSGDRLAYETYYKDYKENTCYDFGLNKKVSASPLEWYQENNYTIIEFDNIDFEEEKYDNRI